MAAAPLPSGQIIAAAAKRYDGEGYVYGGTAARPGDWDCSSFISYVLGHDLGLALPGGRWGGPGMPPAVHGPVVLDYVSWSGAAPVPAGQQAPGDLVCWPGAGTGGHIGFVQGPNQMTSALDSQYGTATTPIQGYGPSDVFVFRRVKGTGGPPPSYPGGTDASAGDTLAAVAIGLLVGGGMIVAVLALAVLAAAGVSAAAMAAARRAASGSAQ